MARNTSKYVWDQVADLPQMLSDGNNLYIPGVGQWNSVAWAYQLPDGLGNVRQLADAQGYLVQRYDYGPFGEALTSEGKRTNSLRYTGEQWDSDVGLLYLRARWYDPATGRFTTRDPFPGFVGLPQTQNPYVYVNNNPINLTDPSGKFVFVPLLIAAGGGALIGGAASGIFYAINHPCEDLFNSPSFWRAVGAGAVGGFVAGLLPIGGSLGAAIVWGMVGGASSAMASQLFVNLTTPGASWDNDLIGAAITGGIAGGVFGGVGYGIRQWLTTNRDLPMQLHHYATNKSKVYTPRFEKIVQRYGLDLDETWNTGLLPHIGRHPNEYHEFVLDGMQRAATEAGKDTNRFIELFEQYVIQPVKDNPELLRKSGWQ
jgi:RHS repeat-associated protein